MKKIAIIDKVFNKTINYKEYFDFNFDLFHLTDKNTKRVLVKDITLNREDPEEENYFDIEKYDFIILVGSDPCKHIGKITSVLKYQGYLVDNKFLPITNPAMLMFKPEEKGAFTKAIKNIHDYIDDKVKSNNNLKLLLIEDYDKAKEYLSKVWEKVKLGEITTIGLDTETSALYCRDGYVLGICMAISETEGSYINSDIIDDTLCTIYQNIFNNVKVVFHNAKFDLHFLDYHFNFNFSDFEDTILLHYLLDERTGIHDLKSLAIKYTDLGEYDKELENYKREYCRNNKIKLSDFTYDLIPFEIIGKYAATDPIATLKLFNIFYPKVKGSGKLNWVYENLLKKGTIFLKQIEDNGVPISTEELKKSSNEINNRILKLEKKLYNFEVISKYEKINGKIFNVNSVQALRTVFFDMLQLDGPGKLTATGALSTDAEVLTELSKIHELPKLILAIKKLKKIKSTYIDKIILSIDSDSRLRTNFNLTTTTSGRLSSSGKINLQQLPREDKTPKRCIRAREGHKIISQDLRTAEMYIVAVLSGDKVLQQIFIEGGDYHSQIAVYKFNLPYTWQEVKANHKDLRQDAKTVSFEILYKLNLREPVLQRFKQLRVWLQKNSEFIAKNGYIYQFFGRKRRLQNVFSSNNEVKNHEIRSGVNALVQGTSSDVNLLAGIEMQEYINSTNMKSKIFALVHDSILAEVPEEEIDEYTNKLKYFTQKDRGLSIPNHPIGVDVEIGNSYSFED